MDLLWESHLPPASRRGFHSGTAFHPSLLQRYLVQTGNPTGWGGPRVWNSLSMKSVCPSGSCKTSPTSILPLSLSVFLTEPVLLENLCPAAGFNTHVPRSGSLRPCDNSMGNT